MNSKVTDFDFIEIFLQHASEACLGFDWEQSRTLKILQGEAKK